MLGQYTSLLVTLFTLYALNPFAQLFFTGHVALILLEILFSALLVTAIYALHQRTSFLLLGGSLALSTVFARWAAYALHCTALFGFGQGCGLLFLAFTTAAILNRVVRDERVTADTVSGAVCGYLMIGLTWAWLFSLLEFFLPGSFRLPDMIGNGDSIAQLATRRLSQFSYFSLVTLSTLGYGDITPVSHPARNLAALEAVVGQLYIAILVARLVGLHIAHSMSDQEK